MKILFLVRSLNYGGCERQVVLLASGLQERGHSTLVATFYKEGDLERELYENKVRVHLLEKGGRWDAVRFFFRLVRVLRCEKPDILYSFLSIPNILSLLTKPFVPSMRIVWGLRASNVELEHYDWVIGLSYLLERWFSRFAQLIIVNSRAGQSDAGLKGFSLKKMMVIPNGIDTRTFRPDSSASKPLRSLWGIGDSDIVIGLVGRLDPMKDHPTFLRAAALLAREREDVRYVCVGDGPDAYLLQLQKLTRDLGLEQWVVWAGAREDMAAVYNTMDFVCSSSSFGEGFSNVIGEAMACGVPCVVTDVGDSASIVGRVGEVVPVRDPQALADGWRRMLDRLREQPSLRIEARDRIVQHFGLEKLLDTTNSVLRNLC